jgi:hypothetical protein
MTLKISKATANPAPVILLYGAEGRGKSTLASKFPDPLGLLLERGLPKGVTIDAVEGLTTYGAVLETMRVLYQDPHGFKTLIIDTLDVLEQMLLEQVCDAHHWKNIEQPPYGKGWVIADGEWRRLLSAIDALRTKHGMTIVLIAHSTIERFDDPRAPSYTMFLPKLHKRARHLVLDACDIVGFLAEDLHVLTSDAGFRERTRATSTNQRFLFVEGNAAFVAKNRFAMPAKIAIPVDFNIAELTKYTLTKYTEE